MHRHHRRRFRPPALPAPRRFRSGGRSGRHVHPSRFLRERPLSPSLSLSPGWWFGTRVESEPSFRGIPLPRTRVRAPPPTHSVPSRGGISCGNQLCVLASTKKCPSNLWTGPSPTSLLHIDRHHTLRPCASFSRDRPRVSRPAGGPLPTLLQRRGTSSDDSHLSRGGVCEGGGMIRDVVGSRSGSPPPSSSSSPRTYKLGGFHATLQSTARHPLACRDPRAEGFSSRRLLISRRAGPAFTPPRGDAVRVQRDCRPRPGRRRRRRADMPTPCRLVVTL